MLPLSVVGWIINGTAELRLSGRKMLADLVGGRAGRQQCPVRNRLLPEWGGGQVRRSYSRLRRRRPV
jgi:hypothetical protein